MKLLITNPCVGRFGGFAGLAGASTRLEARSLGGRTSMQVGANISVRKEVGDKSTKINEPREDPRTQRRSMEVGDYVNAKRPLNSMEVGAKIQISQRTSMGAVRKSTYRSF